MGTLYLKSREKAKEQEKGERVLPAEPSFSEEEAEDKKRKKQ